MASCTAVHVAWAIGLHRELNEIQMRRDTAREVSALEVDIRRRTLWVVMAQHGSFDSEYGRTAVPLDTSSCQPLQSHARDSTAQLVAIMKSVSTNLPADSMADVCLCTF